ncbi:MAG: Ig-like domain-containing protein [Gemmatimonadota bacterium]
MSHQYSDTRRGQLLPSACPPVRPLILLLASGLLACGGSGPSGPGQDHFAISPAGLTLQVGTSGTLTASLNGVELPHVLVTWSSANPLIAPVDTGGHVRGAGIGATLVVASSGDGVDTVPVIVVDTAVVADSGCGQIASIHIWHVNFEFLYADEITTPLGATMHASYNAFSSATLTSAVSGSNLLEWTGELVPGPGHIPHPERHPFWLTENFSDLVSDPTEVITVESTNYQSVPTAGVDGFRLEVDTTACTFRFWAAPATHTLTTVTEHAVATLPGPFEGTHTSDQDTPMGLIQRGLTPLGDWRGPGLIDSVLNFDAYPIETTLAPSITGFTPSGVSAQPAFFDPLNPSPRINKADIWYSFTPVVP